MLRCFGLRNKKGNEKNDGKYAVKNENLMLLIGIDYFERPTSIPISFVVNCVAFFDPKLDRDLQLMIAGGV